MIGEIVLTSKDILTTTNICTQDDFLGTLVNPLLPGSVTILGKAMTSALCPFDTDEIWGVNNVASDPGFEKRHFHKLFAFDQLEQAYTDEMKTHAPICSWQDYKDIPFPIEEVKKEFKTIFFTNTVSYMIAYAIYLKVKKISIYGVDVAFGAPYAQENRGVEYWIGRAHERGIEVEVPTESQLLRTVSGVMYGIKDSCNAMFLLHERIALINMLPRKGHYDEAIKAQNAWWVLFPKSDESQAHGVIVQRSPEGIMVAGFKDKAQMDKDVADAIAAGDLAKAEILKKVVPGEYQYDVHMPPEVWAFLRKMLKDKEAAGELGFEAITMYEKLILSKPDGGN